MEASINRKATERHVKERLRVNLSEDELRDLAGKMAEQQAEIERLEDEKKSITKDYASRIELATGEVRLASSTYRQGWELRDVDCTEVTDYSAGERYYVRDDTGECYKRKKLSQEEMKGSFVNDLS